MELGGPGLHVLPKWWRLRGLNEMYERYRDEWNDVNEGHSLGIIWAGGDRVSESCSAARKAGPLDNYFRQFFCTYRSDKEYISLKTLKPKNGRSLEDHGKPPVNCEPLRSSAWPGALNTGCLGGPR